MSRPPECASTAEEHCPQWFAQFLADRGTRKPSAHTLKAYRQDFDAIASLLADDLIWGGTYPPKLGSGLYFAGRCGRDTRMTAAVRPIDVLLVEDDPGDELITRDAFERDKIINTLHVAHDGQEGLDFLYRRGAYADAPRPGLVLLDLNLPRVNGRQVLETIKSDPELCHIPIVVLTTSSAPEDVLRSYQLHANAYVTKPIDLDQFMGAVRQIDDFFVQVVQLPPA